MAATVSCASTTTRSATDGRPIVASREVQEAAVPGTAGDPQFPAIEPGTDTTTTGAPATTADPSVTRPEAAVSPAPDPAVLLLGDSVLLSAKPMIPGVLPGWQANTDAVQSRQASTAPWLARAARIEGRLGSTVVIHLCTNYSAGGGFEAILDHTMGELASVERVIWVTCVEWSAGQPEANAIIRAAPRRYPNVTVAEWADPARTPGYLYSDGIHLQVPGRNALAAIIGDAVGPARH